MWVSDHGNTAGLSFLQHMCWKLCEMKETVKQQVISTKQFDWAKTCSSVTVNPP